jgi:2-polyprenyl-3-methyl-5-hydroxy-6-metoxy-1,4-benzoquinol methylase
MKRPSSIILVSIDSLRADHLGCYGYPRDTSPFIDKLANQGVLFKNAFSTCSYTVPSHASMFTGKYPSNHSIGFHQKFPKFNKDIDISLAELLASQGYYNIGIVGAMVLRKEIGLDAGFHIYDSEIHDGRRCGDNVNQLFEESLQKALATDKYNGIFGFLHFFDVHLPYVPPHAYKDLFIGDRFYHCYPTDLDIVKDGWGYEGEPVQIGGIPRSAVLQKEDGTLQTNANFYVSQYDACIKYVDDCVRKLITLLKRFGIYDHSVIIITSDHGEAMGENDVWFYHSLTVTPDQIHVPLIIKLPKYYNVQGRVVETPVSLVDLFPTVCDLIGFDWTKIGVDGRSLLQLILKGNDQGLEDRTFISEIEGQISRINRNGITVEPKEANRKDFVFFYVEELCKLRQKFALGKSRTPLIGWTGERYVPWVDLETPEIHYEHLHRYYFASQFVAGKKVLDLASGEGYGCAILSEKAAQVVGIDLDQKTIEHATNRYPLPNVQFIEGTIIDVPIKGEKLFDVITCFEAIEHIEEHEKLLSEVKRLLKDDGIFIISSPNKLLYTDQPGYQNPYHMKELYFDEFRNLLTKYFTYVSFLGQKVFPVSAIWPLETHQGSYADFCIRKTGKGFASANPQEKPALYFIAIASQAPLLHEVHFSTLTDISEELLKRLRYMLAEKERLLSEKNTELLLIYSSFGWRIIQRYRAVADRLFPGGTKRRQLYELTSKSLKVLLTEGPFELAKKIKGWFKGRRELRNPRPTMIKKSLFRKVSLLTDRFEPFSFPANDQPKASIIIPVYNKWLYTYNCLRSIANNTSDVPYEVIVVDNASEDETGEWLDRIENLVVIKNNENEGFIKACNKGAGAARGEFLVFLNNDTVVLPGWLSALIGTLQGEPSVGAVGAKLLYPDGRLQEAGGIIWNDASGWNYGIQLCKRSRLLFRRVSCN